LYWLLTAVECATVRNIEREINRKPPDESDIERRLNESLERARATCEANGIPWTPDDDKRHIAWWHKIEARRQRGRKQAIGFLGKLALHGQPRAQQLLVKMNKRQEIRTSNPRVAKTTDTTD
jgi:hypothetical protein